MDHIHRFNSYQEIEGKYSIPSIQRDLISKHVMDLRDHIRDRISRNKSPIFGALSIVLYNQKYYIIDGQHRLKALEEEYKINNLIVPFNAVIYETQDKEELQEIFKSTNIGIPIPDFLLNSENEKIPILKEIQKHISVKKGFDHHKMNRPYININQFMNTLSESTIIENTKTLSDFQKIYDYVNSKNQDLLMDAGYIKKNKISSNMISKWKEFYNYIGVDLNFPLFTDAENCEILKGLIIPEEIKMIEEKKMEVIENVTEVSEKTKIKRTKFTKSQRQQIWYKYIGADKGKTHCPLCHVNYIEPLNYIIGHVISLSNGGTNEIENVRPICSVCNNSMYTKNIDVTKYKVV